MSRVARVRITRIVERGSLDLSVRFRPLIDFGLINFVKNHTKSFTKAYQKFRPSLGKVTPTMVYTWPKFGAISTIKFGIASKP